MAITLPSPPTGFTLRQNSHSLSSRNWSNAPGTIVNHGITEALIVNPPNGHRF